MSGKSTILPNADRSVPMPFIDAGDPPLTVFTSKFRMGQRVQIDGAPDIVAVVIGFSWQHREGPQLQLAWLHNGEAKEAWIAEWRVAPS